MGIILILSVACFREIANESMLDKLNSQIIYHCAVVTSCCVLRLASAS